MRILKFNLFLTVVALAILVNPQAKSEEECFEGVSRAMFKFNMALDDVVLEPIAKGYNMLPTPIKNGTGNFTSNIGTLLSIPNNIFQGNIKQLGHSVGSFAVNTTVGILGFLNPAEKIGLKPHKEDVDKHWLHGIDSVLLFYQFWTDYCKRLIGQCRQLWILCSRDYSRTRI